MTTARQIFEQLPTTLQQAVAQDWIQRYSSNQMRGLGIAQHYGFLLWVSAEYDISLADLLASGVA